MSTAAGTPVDKPNNAGARVAPLPKWLMLRYSVLWNNFWDNEFTFEQAEQILKKEKLDKLLNIALSKLRLAGWLEVKLDPADARKRIYKLKSPEQAVREMGVRR